MGRRRREDERGPSLLPPFNRAHCVFRFDCSSQMGGNSQDFQQTSHASSHECSYIFEFLSTRVSACFLCVSSVLLLFPRLCPISASGGFLRRLRLGTSSGRSLLGRTHTRPHTASSSSSSVRTPRPTFPGGIFPLRRAATHSPQAGLIILFFTGCG